MRLSLVAVALALAVCALAAPPRGRRSSRDHDDDDDSSFRDDRHLRLALRHRQDREIAAQVAAALAEEPASAARHCPLYRFRLSTVNRRDQCVVFDSDAKHIDETLLGEEISGARVTAFFGDGNFDQVDMVDGVAVGVNNSWSLTVSGDPRDEGNEWLLTSNTLPVEVLRIDTFQSNAVFDVTSNGEGHPDSTPGTDSGRAPNASLVSAAFAIKVGVDGNRAKPDLFALVVLSPPSGDADGLLVNVSQTLAFGLDVDGLESVPSPAFSTRPCFARNKMKYGPTAIVSKRFKSAAADAIFDHPTLFDELRDAAQSSNSLSDNDVTSLDDFVDALRLAGGRRQVLLTDVVVDREFFTDLSTKTHFTPCFRVSDDADFELELFSVADSRRSNDVLLRLHVTDNIFADELGCLPSPAVTAFNGDGSTVYPIQEILFNNADRTFESFDSDVCASIEDCPAFSYFQ